jgi:hypothetical protein
VERDQSGKMIAWVPAIAAAGFVALSKRRTRRQYRDIPVCGKQWPILGRVSAVQVCHSSRRSACAQVLATSLHKSLPQALPYRKSQPLYTYQRIACHAVSDAQFGTLQDAKVGRTHKIWEELADQGAASGSAMTQFNLFGRRLVLITDPKAIEVVLRKENFQPKSRQFYRAFLFLVRRPRTRVAGLHRG